MSFLQLIPTALDAGPFTYKVEAREGGKRREREGKMGQEPRGRLGDLSTGLTDEGERVGG